jgi:hypothetical protein
MVSLIEETMAVLPERQCPDTGSSNFQMVERGGLLDKLGGAAVDSKQSSKSGLACWRCGKQRHIQRNCKGCNYSGAVAAITPKGEPPVSLLGLEDVEVNAYREVETTQTDLIKSRTIDSIGEGGGNSVLQEDITEREGRNN